ncbi:hypothetical protein BN59_00565 [Legionella massiliensis]|uniref:Uncharacterized protein n=1 Tax=Legionella massiliensis TaxID=1034943 RepID=A0A078KX72_9GAMM|nr:hypothetical protein [Legionella massiliensis]CDZ76298.1 hypothetical protein BN59_00565 [Legionella massiliensis]CEE12036.1 hypothetical protein BN1094_00565 [Legionella massiliensis]
MPEKEGEKSESKWAQKTLTGFLALSIATYSLLRRGSYQIAMRLYPKTGGGGLNLYKKKDNGQLDRRFAIDYHPFWDKTTQQKHWKLHYHRGNTSSEMKKHRPYEGGW